MFNSNESSSGYPNKTYLKLLSDDGEVIASESDVDGEHASPPRLFLGCSQEELKLIFVGEEAFDVVTYPKPDGVGMTCRIVGNREHIAGIFHVPGKGFPLYAKIGEEWLPIPLDPTPKTDARVFIALSDDKLGVFTKNTISLWSFATKDWLHQRPGNYRPQKLLFHGDQLFAVESHQTTIFSHRSTCPELDNIERALRAAKSRAARLEGGGCEP